MGLLYAALLRQQLAGSDGLDGSPVFWEAFSRLLVYARDAAAAQLWANHCSRPPVLEHDSMFLRFRIQKVARFRAAGGVCFHLADRVLAEMRLMTTVARKGGRKKLRSHVSIYHE